MLNYDFSKKISKIKKLREPEENADNVFDFAVTHKICIHFLSSDFFFLLKNV